MPFITAAARCAPPGNKPTPAELRNCRPYLERELDLLTNVKVVVALGKIAFDTYLDVLKARGAIRSRAPFVFIGSFTACTRIVWPRWMRSWILRAPLRRQCVR